MSDPSESGWCPAVHARQGIYAGRLERAAEALLGDEDGRRVLRSFGAFEDLYREDPRTRQAVDCLVQLLVEFHPGERPVLWRVLLLHAHLCRGLVELHHGGTTEGDGVPSPDSASPVIPRSERPAFDWRSSGGAAAWDTGSVPVDLVDAAASSDGADPVDVVERYLITSITGEEPSVLRGRPDRSGSGLPPGREA